ncbi:MAG: hypothetical protein MUC49_14510 [Raineya sp.]|jgi:hypothetical protein|nr:hypothetical protein [Raineya sp.]
MSEDATLKLYIFFGERNNQGKRKKIKVEDFGLYLKNNLHVDYGIGHTIIRYQKQKMEFYEFENKLITKILDYIPKMYLKSEFYASNYSEINTGAELYVHFSSINQVIKIAYWDTRIKDALRIDFQDYQSTAMHINACIESGCIIYTKEFIKKNNLTYSYSGENGLITIPFNDYYFDESLIVLPYTVFFGSFFDQVEHYWHILKEAGFISDSWEVLEKAKEIVKDIRFRLDKNMPLF